LGTPGYWRVALILVLPALSAVLQVVSITVYAQPRMLTDVTVGFDADIASTRNLAVGVVVVAVVAVATLVRGAGRADHPGRHLPDKATA
jgi:hypothetical protein